MNSVDRMIGTIGRMRGTATRRVSLPAPSPGVHRVDVPARRRRGLHISFRVRQPARLRCLLMASDANAERTGGSSNAVTGWRGSKEYFRFEESSTFDPATLVSALRGQYAGVICRKYRF